MAMSVEHFTHGKEVTWQPFAETDLSLCAEIMICRADDNLPPHTGIERVCVPMLDDDSQRLKAIDVIIALDDAFEECWHADYEDGENGNCWDQQGTVSVILDNFRHAHGWPARKPSLDKLMVAKVNHYDLNGFHTDHFGGRGLHDRSKGHADRVIFNIGDTSRWLAFLVATNIEVAQYIADSYAVGDYAALARSLQRPKLLLVESAAYGINNSAHGLSFDAFSTLHCSFCSVRQSAVILTNWRPE